MDELITASEFARRMKVSPAAVNKAIKSGRITPVDNPGKSGVWLNPETAAREWTENSRFRIEASKDIPVGSIGEAERFAKGILRANNKHLYTIVLALLV